jgi:hypothetical protein
MPQFPEKESSLLAKLKKGKPKSEDLDNGEITEKKQRPTAIMKNVSLFIYLQGTCKLIEQQIFREVWLMLIQEATRMQTHQQSIRWLKFLPQPQVPLTLLEETRICLSKMRRIFSSESFASF